MGADEANITLGTTPGSYKMHNSVWLFSSPVSRKPMHQNAAGTMYFQLFQIKAQQDFIHLSSVYSTTPPNTLSNQSCISSMLFDVKKFLHTEGDSFSSKLDACLTSPVSRAHLGKWMSGMGSHTLQKTSAVGDTADHRHVLNVIHTFRAVP